MAGYFFPGVALSQATELIRTLGGDPAALSRTVGLPVDALEKPDIPLPGRAVFQLFERAAETCNCPDFGLRLAGRNSLAIMGPLWVLLRNASTVRQLLEELVANYDLFTRAAMASLEPERGGVMVCWDAAAGVADSSVQAAEFSYALLVNELREHLTPRWQPQAMQFRHRAPAQRTTHRKIFGPGLRFDQDRNALYVERDALEKPLNPEGSRARAMARALLRLEGDSPDEGIATRVETIVRALLPYTPCKIDHVSQAMGLCRRTLQFKLSAQDETFKGIKDRVRADMAMHYLRHSALSLCEIADILGYSELSAFSRSFRRWHGVTAQSIARRGS